MLHNSLAQPAVINDLKKILEGLDAASDLPDAAKISIKNALGLIARHQDAPIRFRKAVDEALTDLAARPVEQFMSAGADRMSLQAPKLDPP
jgi:hypothetical protein